MVNNRRIVTGLDEEGRSCILLDAEAPRSGKGEVTTLLWQSRLPAENSSREDAARSFDIAAVHYDGSNFMLIEFPAGMKPYHHATDTLDYLIMLSGRVTLELENGSVTLNPGDFLINRGVVHGWRNDSDEPARLAGVTVPSIPVAGGRTI